MKKLYEYADGRIKVSFPNATEHRAWLVHHTYQVGNKVREAVDIQNVKLEAQDGTGEVVISFALGDVVPAATVGARKQEFVRSRQGRIQAPSFRQRRTGGGRK